MISKICQWLKPISISLSPNVQKDDLSLVWRLIFNPFKWKKGEQIKKLEDEFKYYLSINHAVSFNSGRSAFLSILESLDLTKGDQVLLQAFTCNAAANPIIWAGFSPVYVDCKEDDFNIDPLSLKEKIESLQNQGKNPKAVVVQHTFGQPAEMEEISKICKENNLFLIEDCAHSLGAEYSGKKVGAFGDAAFFSFSRDKAISSVYGGMAVTNSNKFAKKIRELQKQFSQPSFFWIFQQLLHPILMNYLVLPTYRVFGKYLLVFFQITKILSKAVHWKEKQGKKPDYFPKKLSNALAVLASHQFRKLDQFNKHRQKIARFYYGNLKDSRFDLPKSFLNRRNIFLRFTIKHSRAHKIIKKAWHNNLLIGDWYTSPIAPYDTKLRDVKYDLGSCPTAEKLAKETFNLPTHINISKKEAKKIIDFLKSFPF